MSGAAYLVELARQVRGGTIELLEAARPEWLLWAPPGTSNHILWHAGHALWLQDALCIRPLTGRSQLPDGWAGTFGMNCRPPRDTRNWPGRAQVAFALKLQLEEMLVLFRKSADALAHAFEDGPEPLRRRGLVPGILHGLHDEARHQGEMYLLLKLCRAGHHPDETPDGFPT